MTTEGIGDLRQAIPFFKVADVDRSLGFYRDGLGFQTRHKWEVDGRLRWCWLQRGDVALMLQQFPTEGRNAWRPEGKVGEGVSICVMCDDAPALYREFRSRGLEASRPFVGNGLWVTSVSDPDGFRLDFESPADAPEGTEYAEA
jgi:catechol 2,3-dioxygenase-like lactoylglutathione lyase family enzyme